MTKKIVKGTTILIDQDMLHSFIEGGLWSMRLLKDHESVTGVQLVGNQYEIYTNAEVNSEQADLPW